MEGRNDGRTYTEGRRKGKNEGYTRKDVEGGKKEGRTYTVGRKDTSAIALSAATTCGSPAY
jgi:hypothetical protein